jgi:hypothetical protein
LNCLTFTDEAGLKSVVDDVLAMSVYKIQEMRCNVIKYYKAHLEPKKWISSIIIKGAKKILVNAEELSILKKS